MKPISTKKRMKIKSFIELFLLFHVDPHKID